MFLLKTNTIMNVEGFTSSFSILHRPPPSCFKLLSQQNDAYVSSSSSNNNNNVSGNGNEQTLEEIQLQMIEEKLKQVANRRMEMAKQLEAAELERSRLAAEVQKVKKELWVEQNIQKQQEPNEPNESVQTSQIKSESSKDYDTESSQTVVNLNSKVPKDVIHNNTVVDTQVLEKQGTIPSKDDSTIDVDSTTSTMDQHDTTPSLSSLQDEQKNGNRDQVVDENIEMKPQKDETNDLMLKPQKDDKNELSNSSEPTKNKKKTLTEYFSEQNDIQAKESKDSSKDIISSETQTLDTKMNKNETLFEYLNKHKIDRKEEYDSNPKAMNMADYIKENQKDAETALKDFERKLQSGEIEGQVQEKLKIAQDQLKGVQKQLEEYKDSLPYTTSSSTTAPNSSSTPNSKDWKNFPLKIPDMKWNDDSISIRLFTSANEIITKLKSLTGDQMVTIGTPMASFVLFAALRSALEDRPIKRAEMEMKNRDQERQMKDSNTSSSSVNEEFMEKGGNQKLQEGSKVTKSSYSKWEEPIVPRKEDDIQTQEMIYYQSPSKSTLYDSEPFVSYNAPPDDDEFEVEESTTEMEDESSLPEGWYEYIDPASGNPYYWNENTGVTTWDNPSSLSS